MQCEALSTAYDKLKNGYPDLRGHYTIDWYKVFVKKEIVNIQAKSWLCPFEVVIGMVHIGL